MTYRYALNVSTAANLVSTLIGVRMCWLFLLIAEFTLLLIFNVTFGLTKIPGNGFAQDTLFLLETTWPVLYEGNTWFVPVSLLILQIPFCLTSIYIELLVVEAMRPVLPFKDAVIWANITFLHNDSPRDNNGMPGLRILKTTPTLQSSTLPPQRDVTGTTRTFSSNAYSCAPG